MRTRLVEVDDATAVMNIYNPEVNEASISFDLVRAHWPSKRSGSVATSTRIPASSRSMRTTTSANSALGVSEYWVSRSSRRFATARLRHDRRELGLRLSSGARSRRR